MSKVAIVTGGTKGIGLAVVKRLLTSGYEVHNLDITPSDVGVFHHCDVSDVEAVRRSINTIHEQSQRIDVLVSNCLLYTSDAADE